MLVGLGCGVEEPLLQPDGMSNVASVQVKFFYRQPDGRQSGRILWRWDGKQSRLLFFSPLNQVVADLYAQDEAVVFLNRSKKLFWQGDFRELIRHFWDMDLTLDELQKLVFSGVVPRPRPDSDSLRITVSRSRRTQAVKRAEMTRADARLLLRLGGRKLSPGKIEFTLPPWRRETNLDEVLNAVKR